ncbi:MAG: hypothetical protein OHK0039_17600 [Bacteroidia bacterium]
MNPHLRSKLHMESEPWPGPLPEPLFIAGCMRSGTTLLVDKISQHPQLLKIGVELNDIWTAIGGATCANPCQHRTEQHATYEAAQRMTDYFTRYLLDARSLRRHLMRAKNRYRQGSGRIFYDWEHIVPVNKSPHLSNKLRYVQTLFPKARFIYLIRSIEGHSASMKVHFDRNYRTHKLVNYIPADPFGCYTRVREGQPIAEPVLSRQYPGDFSVIPEMWIRVNATALDDLRHIDPARYRIVVYEDLVQRQPEVLRGIFDFLRLDSRHQALADKIADSGMRVINTTTAGDPLDKWRETLGATEKQQLADVVGRMDTAYQAIMATVAASRLA